jgi:hypothetical protein
VKEAVKASKLVIKKLVIKADKSNARQRIPLESLVLRQFTCYQSLYNIFFSKQIRFAVTNDVGRSPTYQMTCITAW